MYEHLHYKKYEDHFLVTFLSGEGERITEGHTRVAIISPGVGNTRSVAEPCSQAGTYSILH